MAAHIEGAARLPIRLIRGRELEFGNTGRILFNADLPLAVWTGGYVYFPDYMLTPTESRAINKFTQPHHIQVRMPAEQFRFIVGQVLAQAGLQLTAIRLRHSGDSDDQST